MHDLLILGGTLFDGTGAAPRRTDVAVRDGRIAEVGDLAGAEAKRTVDAEGALVLPGFVDVHTHYDLCLDWEGLSAHCLRQGITTVVGGNCGLGDADVGRVLKHAAEADLALHFAVLAPLGPLRSRIVPRAEGRPASATEREQIAREVASALDAGAVGVSWGPYHANGLMDPDELRAALRVAAGRAKPFCVHRRSEGVAGLAATEEAVGLARDTGVRLQISHLKAAGRMNWGAFEPVLSCVEAARKDVDLAVDLYPYDASLTYLSAMVPDHLKADGGLLARLATDAGWAEAHTGIERWFTERQGPEHVVLLEPKLEVAPGADLASAARTLGCADPAEAALKLIQADPAGTGGWATYRHMMSPGHVDQLLGLSYAAVASDAVPEEDGSGLSAHPRVYATFARALDKARASADSPAAQDAALADAVRRCTSFPAQRLGLDRGRLAKGEPADLLVVRDLVDRASYERPDQYPGGIACVVVGGQVVLEDGELTGERPGRVLRT